MADEPRAHTAAAMDAYAAGYAAGRGDRPVTDCPYTDADPGNRLLRRQWVRGHADAHPAPPETEVTGGD